MPIYVTVVFIHYFNELMIYLKIFINSYRGAVQILRYLNQLPLYNFVFSRAFDYAGLRS